MRFEVTQPFESVSYCHCTNCKKISGGAGTVSGRVRSDAIRVRAGEELLRSFQPAEGTAKTFCSVCGSNLFGGGWPESEECSVRLSAIDGAIEGEPSAHIYTRSVATWETLPDDGLPRYETQSP